MNSCKGYTSGELYLLPNIHYTLLQSYALLRTLPVCVPAGAEGASCCAAVCVRAAHGDLC